MKQMTLLVSGKVQGVFFRSNTKQQAEELGLSGYVRNLEDGRVKIVARGDRKNVDRLVEWAKEGPAQARVDEIKVKNVADSSGSLDGFEVRR